MPKDDVKFSIGVNDRTKAAFKRLRKSLGSIKRHVFNLKTAVLALAGVGGFGALTAASFRSIDALSKTADKLGLTTEALAGLRHAAELTGISQNTLDMAMQRMTRRLAEAAKGTGEAKAAIKELGLDAKELAAGSPDEAFRKIAGAMENVTNKSDKLRLAFKLFDSEGAALVNTLALGEAGLADMAAEARALGLAVTGIEAAKIEAANDAFVRVKGVIKGISNQIAIALAPWLEAISEYLVSASIESDGFKKTIGGAIKTTIEGVALLGDSFSGLVRIWHAIKFAFMAFADAFWQTLSGIDRGITDFLNKLPGISVEYSTFIQGVAETSTANLDMQWEKLREKLNEPLPGNAIRDWFKNVEKNATFAAKAVRKTKEGVVKVEKKGNTDILKETAKSAAGVFGIQKKLSVATILAKAPQAIASAYANAGGFPMGIPAAAITAAKMAAEVAAAGGVSLGGGGSVGSGGGGGGGSVPSAPPIPAAVPNQAQQTTTQQINVTIDGILPNDPDQLDQLAESIANNIANGGRRAA